MENFFEKKLFALCSFLFLGMHFCALSQTEPDKTLNNWFDTSIGTENLKIINGKVHLNQLIGLKKENCYLNNFFSNGNLTSENENYYNLLLKYDISNDVLILNNNSIEIELIQEKIARFSIDDKEFINLSYSNSSVSDFISGYYEVFLKSSTVCFYIKHKKKPIKIITSEGVFYQFELKNKYVCYYNNTFYNLDSKKEIITIFPNLKTKINVFYKLNFSLEKEDKLLFMKKMMMHLQNLIQENPKQ